MRRATPFTGPSPQPSAPQAPALVASSALLAACALFAACTSSVPPARPPGGGPAEAEAPTGNAADATRADPQKGESAPPSARPGSDAKADGASNQPRRAALALPSDPIFLSAPLPPPVPDRYQSWREVARIDVGQSHLMEVDRLPSGGLVALSQTEGKVRIYEAGTRRLRARHDAVGWDEYEPSALLAFPGAPDRYLLANPTGLGVFDAESGALVAQVLTTPVWKLRFSADKRVLMVLSAEPPGAEPAQQGSRLRFFARGEGSELTQLGELLFEERVDAWDLSPDARLLAVAHYPSNDFRILDLASGGREIHRGPAPQYTGDLAFSPDGRFLALAGDGLLLVDLLNPARVAFYSYVKNNMGHVRFSPSSDAVAASSYDGKIRIFGVGSEASGALRLELLKELSHAGQANVYAFVFSADGSDLVSASGDRTLRVFSGRQKGPAAAAAGPARAFHDLATWKELEPAAAKPLPTPVAGEPGSGAAAARARPARMEPGIYNCKITHIYKLRTCWVHLDADGRTRLEFAPDNLLHLGGMLWDDGPAVRFEGKLLTPSSLFDCQGCDDEPLHAVFRGKNGKYTGLLTFRKYHDPHVPAPVPALDVKFEEANDRYPLVLEYVGPLDSPSASADQPSGSKR